MPPPAIQASTEDVSAAIASFPTGTAAGGSGLRAQHLKDTSKVRDPLTKEAFLLALTGLINVLLKGQAPKCLSQLISAAPLIALRKKDDGIRPIAIGETLRRLTAKICLQKNHAAITQYFSPYQVGLNVKCGGEAIVHSVASIIERYGLDSSVSMLKIDFKNAFNLVNRSIIFEEVRRLFPSMSSWVEYCYSDQPYLWFDRHEILSCNGVQQGDPLGPFLFSLVLHKLIKIIEEKFPNLLFQAWYLDDGTIIGNIETIKSILTIIQEIGPSLGMSLNLAKCEIWWPTIDQELWNTLPDTLIKVLEDGIELLGCPLGSTNFSRAQFKKRIDKICIILKELMEVRDPQVEYALLRSCCGFPKIAFSLRTIPPNHIEDLCRQLDMQILENLNNIVGYGITDIAWKQATLPISKGGFGVPSAVVKSNLSFVASIAQSWPIQQQLLRDICDLPRSEWIPSLTKVNQVLDNKIETLNELMAKKHPQAFLSDLVDEKAVQSLLAILKERDKARIKSCSLPHASDYLLVLPNAALRLQMSPYEFTKAARLRLGLAIFPKTRNCPKCKSCVLDVYGQHAQNCKTGGAPTSRHNKIRDLLFSQCQASVLAPRKEVQNLLDNTGEKPADIFIPSWSNGCPAAIDVTITNPLNMDIVSKSANQAGSAAAMRAASKITKYHQACASKNINFIPFALETFGGFSKEAQKVINKVTSALALNAGWDYKVIKKQFYERLSVQIQKQNASTLSGFEGG